MYFFCLLHIINWILETVSPLKTYFVNQPKCPMMVLNFKCVGPLYFV